MPLVGSKNLDFLPYLFDSCFSLLLIIIILITDNNISKQQIYNYHTVHHHSYFSTSDTIEVKIFGIEDTPASCKSDSWYSLSVINNHSRERRQSPERTASGVVTQGKYFLFDMFILGPCKWFKNKVIACALFNYTQYRYKILYFSIFII